MNYLLVAAPADGGQGAYMQFIMMGAIIVVFYFFMIRPQMKKQKEITAFRNSLAKGDKVVTTGGIYGKIIELKENYVLLQVDDNVKLRVDKAALVKDMSDVSVQK